MNLNKSKRLPERYGDLKDRELVRLYRDRQDELAFRELMNRHQAKIYSYIYSMVNNREVTNDLFQETFTKVITKMDDTYNEQGKWIAWVMRIAYNTTIDYIRKQKRFVDMGMTEKEGEKTDFYDRLPDEDRLGQQEEMEMEESHAELLQHISELPEEQRTVVMLRHFYEMPFKEIAEMTGVSINTALGRMRYALINLRKMFDQTAAKEARNL
ncbi:MAG: sigma-70 family RNA polymerase sigma factor [Balneolaceae bacterium]